MYIRKNMEDYHVTTIPYESKVTYEMDTEKILNGIRTPIKVTTIYNTDVYLWKVFESVSTINKKEDVIIEFGFDYHYTEPQGEMLSIFRVNDNNAYTHLARIEAYDENGKQGVYGTGVGDTDDNRFEESIGITMEKDDLMRSSKWTFEISDLYQLTYRRK